MMETDEVMQITNYKVNCKMILRETLYCTNTSVFSTNLLMRFSMGAHLLLSIINFDFKYKNMLFIEVAIDNIMKW